MIKTNAAQLVCQSVIGEITSPQGGINPYRINPDGHADVYPGVGGITYNLRIGDLAGEKFGDHVEPAVSISNFTQLQGQPGPNRALNQFSCVGNLARVVSGDAKGETGRVTGKHGGIEHVLVDFAPEVLERLMDLMERRSEQRAGEMASPERRRENWKVQIKAWFGLG